MAKTFSMVIGFVFLFLGILGFFFEHLFGIFHLDIVHNTVHLAVGICGVLASAKDSYSAVFSRLLGILFLIIGLAGFFSPDLFGLMHVGIAENILHLIVGALSLYIGFRSVTEQPQTISKSA